MANIRNSISMADHMTPTLRAIIKSMDSMLKAMDRIDRETNKGANSRAYRRAEKDIKSASNAVIKMKNYTDMAGASAERAGRSYRNMGRSASNGFKFATASSGMFLQSLASGVYLAEKLTRALGGVMSKADESRAQVARLGLYNTSKIPNEALYAGVFRTAMDTRSGLSDTADLANKILISGVYEGDTAAQAAIGTAGLINKAMIAGGGTQEEIQRALRQLTQGLASGVLQGDELRSLREQTPYFTSLLAQGLGEVDEKFAGIGIGDLKKLGAQGVLTSDVIVKAMWAMQDKIDKDFKKMPKTFGQAMTSLSNIWQYFLYLLSDVDGPLGKINKKLWQFVEYLQTDRGTDLLQTLAIGVNIVATVLSGALTAAGDFVTFLQDNVPIAQALFIALGTVAVAAGIKTAVAWVAALWPILLVVAVIGGVAYAFLQAGYTAQQVVGAICGGIMFTVGVLWDAVIIILDLIMLVCAGILIAAVGLGAGVILIIQGVIQIIIWAVMLVVTLLWFIFTVIKSVFLLSQAAVQTFVDIVVSLFYGLAQAVLAIMGIIAAGIDAVFGSDLADSVSGWSKTLEGDYTAFIETNDPSKTLDEIQKSWDDFGSGVSDMFTSDDFNLYGEMGGVVDGAGGLIGSIIDGASAGDDFLSGMMKDPMSMYDAGNAWGAGLVDQIYGVDLGLPSNSVLDAFNPDGLQISGGDLDSVGKIKSDVDINEEDLKLLRDMAARDYLLQMQAITPVANVTFGDVRETADVNRIVEVIEQMVDEQLATSLVS